MTGPVAILLAARYSKRNLLRQEVYRKSYQRLAELAVKKHIDLRFIQGKKHYQDGMFDGYWKFEGPELTYYPNAFKAELVFLQTRYVGLTFEKRVNNPFLEHACRNKLRTAELLNNYSKKTVFITGKKSISDFTTDQIVVKPQFGTDGEDVAVVTSENFRHKKFLDQKFIAQEFIDSSDGIKGIIDQRHELRMYIFDGELKAAYLRLPAEDSFLSNVSQGATEKQLDLKDLPESVRQLKNDVDTFFKEITPRLYTIDVMFENKKPWIVELNDMPGMPNVDVQPLTNTFHNALLTLFETALM